MSFDFHVVVHGILIVEVHQPNGRDPGFAEIVVPYDTCHSLIAACMDFDGSVIWQRDLPMGRHHISAVAAPACAAFSIPDQDLVLCGVNPNKYGSNTWCTIGPFPAVKPIPLRRFIAPVLDPKCSAYTNYQLQTVDAAGVGTAYALMFGPQDGRILLDMGDDAISIMPGKDSVARLHIYAEPPTNMIHNALATLNHCGGFDLESNGNQVQAPMGKTPGCIQWWEQEYLYEHQQIRVDKEPPCFGMDDAASGHVGNASGRRNIDSNNPRTCIPVVGNG